MRKTEKLQKVLARAGYASRRELELWIKAGRIEVNDHVAIVGERVAQTDKIYVDGKLCGQLCGPLKTRILLYNKPEGLITTRFDPEGRKTVFETLPPIRDGKWINVGRLDVNTSGLLLFTNNGELAHTLTHPSSKLEREYAVRVMGRVTQEHTRRLTCGVELEDGMARFEDIVDSGGEGLNHWFHVVVVEGRTRVVRRLWESQGLKVNRLKRVRFGSVFLPKSLRQGAWLELEPSQVQRLQQFCDSVRQRETCV